MCIRDSAAGHHLQAHHHHHRGGACAIRVGRPPRELALQRVQRDSGRHDRLPALARPLLRPPGA
eukprot:5311379-Alexandrium_andersonii.AAC.1